MPLNRGKGVSTWGIRGQCPPVVALATLPLLPPPAAALPPTSVSHRGPGWCSGGRGWGDGQAAAGDGWGSRWVDAIAAATAVGGKAGATAGAVAVSERFRVPPWPQGSVAGWEVGGLHRTAGDNRGEAGGHYSSDCSSKQVGDTAGRQWWQQAGSWWWQHGSHGGRRGGRQVGPPGAPYQHLCHFLSCGSRA